MSTKYPLFKVHMPESVQDPLLATLFSGFIGQGKKVEEFEDALRKFFNFENILTLNSGTSALQLALRLADVGPNDEVISTPMTCAATNMPIMACGAKIIWADIDELSGNISASSIEKEISDKTKAIMMVHWGGLPCDVERINQIAKDRGISVIEDAAHAFGAEFGGKKIGNHSDFVIFSLQAIKHITTVDGGLLFCKDRKRYERGKLLRWYGIDRESKNKKFRFEEDILDWGYKFHMNDISATIGLEQLKFASEILEVCRSNGEFYNKTFSDHPNIRTAPIPHEKKHAYWIYTLHVSDPVQFIREMADKGIMASQVHARNDRHKVFEQFKGDNLVGIDRFINSMVCIPCGYWIDHEARKYIADCVLSYADEKILS